MNKSCLLSDLLDFAAFAKGPIPRTEIYVSGITDDSRRVAPGYLFVAVPGVNVDGHRFIGTAVDAGATAVIGERPRDGVDIPESVLYIQVNDSRQVLGWLHAGWYQHPSDNLVLIGVTGTDGKTTTTNLIHAILGAEGLTTGMISTVNARIGTESYDTGLHTTTPSSSNIQRYLAQMVASGASHAVLEATSHGLAQSRLAGCQFDVAVVTNVTHEHLDFHRNWDAYIEAKARLFKNLVATRQRHSKKIRVTPAAVLNGDDPKSLSYLSRIGVDRQIIYGVTSSLANVYAREISFDPDELRFQLITPVGDIGIRSSLVGLYNVSNILAAASVAVALGLSLDSIAEGTAQVHSIPGRMERIKEGQDFIAIVDFAHTPNAIRRALETAQAMVGEGGDVIAVFGCAGQRDREKRYMMGLAAGELADYIVVTAEDPRTESLDTIMEETTRGLTNVGREEGRDFWLVRDRGEAILKAVEMAKAGDIVIAFGKGHEQSMCFGETEYPWDDRRAMRLALDGVTLDTLPTSSSSN
jgi:UDP-N-acetylmuramoyl-L-alanyl-D-glutamate--2,6-diaminopimelate ligase